MCSRLMCSLGSKVGAGKIDSVLRGQNHCRCQGVHTLPPHPSLVVVGVGEERMAALPLTSFTQQEGYDYDLEAKIKHYQF